jgi:hypothetical protein
VFSGSGAALDIRQLRVQGTSGSDDGLGASDLSAGVMAGGGRKAASFDPNVHLAVGHLRRRPTRLQEAGRQLT